MTNVIVAELLKLTAIAAIALAALLIITIWKKNRTTKVTYLKFVIQILSLVGIFYLFTYPVRPLFVLIVILILPLFFGRFFCGWICPFGLYMDMFSLIRKALGIRYINLYERFNRFLHNLRYVLLLVFLLLPFLLLILEPPSSFDLFILMALIFAGPFEYVGVLLGPLVPLIVPWQGPLEINGLFFSYPYVQEVIRYSTENFVLINVIIFLVLTTLGSIFVRRVWCRFCPTGSSIAVLNKIRLFNWSPLLFLEKNETKCTKCGICKRVCPVQVEEVYEKKGGKIMTSMCMLCLRCVEMCPYQDCLKVMLGNKTIFKSRNWLDQSENN